MNFFKNRPLATCCAAFIFTYFVSIHVSPLAKLLIASASVAAGLIAFRRRRLVLAVSVFVIIGCLLGYLYFDVYVRSAYQIRDAEDVRLEIADISFADDSIAFLDAVDERGYKIHCTLYTPPEIEIGDIIEGRITYKEIESSDDFDAERYYHAKNIWSEGEISEAVVVGHNGSFVHDIVSSVHGFCTDVFNKYTGDDVKDLLTALSIGDRSTLDESVERDFRRAGLSHMLAISGMHLSVIMGGIAMLSDLLGFNKRWSSLFIIVICICYIFIAEASSSILRAGIMFIIMSFASVFRRVSDSLTNLMLAVTLILLFSPSSVFDAGLILSFTATLGIVVIVGDYMRRVKNKNHTLLHKLWYFIFVSLLTTVSAYAFSFIFMLSLFDSFSVVSMLSNLLISPLITIVLFCIPLLLAVSRVTYVAMGVGYLLDAVTCLMLWCINKIASVPNALVDLGSPFVPYTFIAIAAGIVLIFVMRKRNAYLMPYLCWFVAFVMAFSIYNFNYLNQCDMVMYSEASSDAIIIRNFEGCIYIDLGKGSGAAQDRAFNVIEDQTYVNEIDHWVINNYTNSIVKSVNDKLNEFYIRNLYIPSPYDAVSEAASEELEYYADKENVKVVYYEYGDVLMLNNISVRIYEPFRFEDSAVFIPSADIECGSRTVSYVGCGYFDYCDSVDEYDILYIGECGTRRKQNSSPVISCNASYVAENNDTAAHNVENRKFEFDDENNITKIRISR